MNLMDWNVKNLSIMKDGTKVVGGKFAIENYYTTEMKQAIIDKYTDNLCTYVLMLASQLQRDAKHMHKTKLGDVYVQDLRRWLEAFDTRRVVYEDTKSDNFGHTVYYPHKYETGLNAVDILPNKHILYIDDFAEYINQMFHRLLQAMYIAEKQYYAQTDSYMIALKQLCDKLDASGNMFNVGITYCSDGTVYLTTKKLPRHVITMDEIRILIEQIDVMETYINDLTQKTEERINALYTK
jgi:hypothetical protein